MLRSLLFTEVVDVKDGKAGTSVESRYVPDRSAVRAIGKLSAMTYGFLSAYREGRKYFSRARNYVVLPHIRRIFL
jgi:hypothetical protein